MFSLRLSRFSCTFILLCAILSQINCYDDWVYKTIRDEEAKSENISECGICNLLNQSFAKGLDFTKSSELPENSEIRLSMIQEHICTDQQYGKNRCLRLAADKEDLIEEWWKMPNRTQNLYDYLCVDKLKLCCHSGIFGENCDKKCPGYPDNICNKNGKCEGNGDKKGSGVCVCEKGSKGSECEECEVKFVKINGVCERCDRACDQAGCSKLGPDGCLEGCNQGFRANENGICEDIDECKEGEEEKCPPGELCHNLYGDYHCIKCDKVCKTCSGLGKDQCIECADGFYKERSMCVSYEESQESNRNEIIKYLIYVLVTVLTCILMNYKPLVALLITVFFSTYVGFHEYANLNNMESVMQAYEDLFF